MMKRVCAGQEGVDGVEGRMREQEIVVIGLGNPLMTDEGIGIHLVAKLAERAEFPDVGFHDLGTSGTRILHVIAGKRKAIFVDCALMGEEPGVIRRFTPEDAQSVKNLGQFSLHEVDLFSILELSRRLGECPGEIVIFGIQPQAVSPGRALSPVLAAKLDKYVASVTAELQSD